MRAKYDDYFSTMARLRKGDLSGKEKNTQLNRLHQSLEDWGLPVFHDIAFEWFVAYDTHGHYPYPGAWANQPRKVQKVLHTFTMLQRWHELNEDLPSVEGLPTVEQLT